MFTHNVKYSIFHDIVPFFSCQAERTTQSHAMSNPLVTALAGVTIASSRPDLLVSLFSEILGWDRVSDAPLDEELRPFWGASPEADDSCVILSASGANRGMVRIIAGPDRAPTDKLRTRLAGVEILVARDLTQLYSKVAVHPAFATTHRPFETDWSDYGSNVHRAFIGIGTGGTHLAFTMAVTTPVGRDFPATDAGVGYIFDVPLLTANYDASSRFYRETLGMIPILESHFTDAQWHALWDLPSESPVHLDILKGDAPDTGLGGIELQGYEQHLIDDTPARPDRLDGGASILTYTSTDIEAAFAAVSADPSAKILGPLRPIAGAPYNGTRAFCFMGPDGERIEICEQSWR